MIPAHIIPCHPPPKHGRSNKHLTHGRYERVTLLVRVDLYAQTTKRRAQRTIVEPLPCCGTVHRHCATFEP
ncbi:unnamed protein product [Tuber melanosporum]|uniref:(Perigord truffle) hypothetical protein n=1 Tax=Tuber melanosporum (strain Mel28) TaxID=656061 RepID=D5G482_TUBMM|nr:uncharacterized protein GSTUM_00003995001 [Tuber melanosporum]CAZ79325.1 unnamed protein product [Tuber melanosporum]